MTQTIARATNDKGQRKRPLRNSLPIRSPSTQVAYRICQFTYDQGECDCHNEGRRTPCAALLSVAKACVAIAKDELKAQK